MPSQKTADLLAAFVVSPLALAALVWWFGPSEVISFIVTALVVVLVIGVPLQVIVWFGTGGR